MIISWPHFSHIFSWIRRKKYELNVCSFIPLSLNGPSLIISPAHDPGSLKFYENFRLHFYHLSELRLLRRHIIAAAEENFAEKAFCGRTESDGAEKVTLPTAHLLTCVCMYVCMYVCICIRANYAYFKMQPHLRHISRDDSKCLGSPRKGWKFKSPSLSTG